MYNYLSFVYWLNLRPAPLGTTGQRIITGIIVGLVIIAIIVFIEAYSERLKHYKALLSRVVTFCLTNVVIGLAMLFFNYELIPFFRARFWYVLWGIGAALWIWYIYRRATARKNTAASQTVREAEIKKYLPQ